MKILSHQEFEFLMNPEKFNRSYQYVLTHRIKKKIKEMEVASNFIYRKKRALMSIKNRKDLDKENALLKQRAKWKEIVDKAFNLLKEDKEKKYLPIAQEMEKKDSESKNIDEYNAVSHWYNKEIVKLYLGDEYLKYESEYFRR